MMRDAAPLFMGMLDQAIEYHSPAGCKAAKWLKMTSSRQRRQYANRTHDASDRRSRLKFLGDTPNYVIGLMCVPAPARREIPLFSSVFALTMRRLNAHFSPQKRLKFPAYSRRHQNLFFSIELNFELQPLIPPAGTPRLRDHLTKWRASARH